MCTQGVFPPCAQGDILLPPMTEESQSEEENSLPVGEMPSDDGAITKIDEGDGRLLYTLILEETGKVPQDAENNWWHWFVAH